MTTLRSTPPGHSTRISPKAVLESTVAPGVTHPALSVRIDPGIQIRGSLAHQVLRFSERNDFAMNRLYCFLFKSWRC